MKHALLASVLISSIVSATVSATAVSLLVPRPAQAQDTPQDIVLRSITLVDDSGQERMYIGPNTRASGFGITFTTPDNKLSGYLVMGLEGAPGASPETMQLAFGDAVSLIGSRNITTLALRRSGAPPLSGINIWPDALVINADSGRQIWRAP